MRIDQTLLQAIQRDPDDDVARLAYADWLEEHGDEAGRDHGDFIRLQIALERDTIDSPERRERAFRMRQLRDLYEQHWLASLAACQLHNTLFRQGFLDKAGVVAADLENHAELLFSLAPLRRLWLTCSYGDVAVLRAIPGSNQLRELDLTGEYLDAEELAVMAGLPNLGALRVLNLSLCALEDDCVETLCRQGFYQRLGFLRCGGNHFSEPARERLRTHFGTRVTFEVERDADHLYAIQNERFTAGFGSEHLQILSYGTSEEVRRIDFDHEGRVLDVTIRQVPQVKRPPGSWLDLPLETRNLILHQESENRSQTRNALLQEVGFQPRTIHVRRFTLPDGTAIDDFPGGWLDACETGEGQELDDARNWLDDWLARGQFVYFFGGGGDWWLNAEGEVTST